MEIEIDKARWTQDDDGFWLCVRTEATRLARKIVNGISSAPNTCYVVKVDKKRKKRSLDANAYCWVLLDKLAVAVSKDGITISPEEIYRNLIPFVGGNSKILPIKEDVIEAWKQIWSAGRTGWLCEDMGECKNLPGYHNIRCFYGSSVYDTEQMSRLIDLIVQECKQLNIETATPAELSLMKSGWDDAQTNKGG